PNGALAAGSFAPAVRDDLHRHAHGSPRGAPHLRARTCHGPSCPGRGAHLPERRPGLVVVRQLLALARDLLTAPDLEGVRALTGTRAMFVLRCRVVCCVLVRRLALSFDDGAKLVRALPSILLVVE